MATPGEIANDLEARARLFERTRHSNDAETAKALRRAAACIRNLDRENRVLAENTTVSAIVVMGADSNEC